MRHCPRLHQRIVMNSPNGIKITCPASWKMRLGQCIKEFITCWLISDVKNWREYTERAIRKANFIQLNELSLCEDGAREDIDQVYTIVYWISNFSYSRSPFIKRTFSRENFRPDIHTACVSISSSPTKNPVVPPFSISEIRVLFILRIIPSFSMTS